MFPACSRTASCSAIDGGSNDLPGLNRKFCAEFSAVLPEPSSVLLVGAGLAVLLMRRHRLG